MFSIDKALGIHPHALNLRVERTRVLASNIANVETPGYLAKDYDFKGTLQNLAKKLENGESLKNGDIRPSSDLKYRIPMQPSENGNTVELGIEQSAFAQNAMDFQSSLTFLNMKISGLKMAIDGR